MSTPEDRHTALEGVSKEAGRALGKLRQWSQALLLPC